MIEQNICIEPIPVPAEVSFMTPKEVILLMRALGVGKINRPPPDHARAWTTAEFLQRCLDPEVLRGQPFDPPERTTVEGWFSPNGPLPNDRRHKTWHFFFHVFFQDSRRSSGTLEWRQAYFVACTRAKIAAARCVPDPVSASPLMMNRPIDAVTDSIFAQTMPEGRCHDAAPSPRSATHPAPDSG